jgi:hypothetical protein
MFNGASSTACKLPSCQTSHVITSTAALTTAAFVAKCYIGLDQATTTAVFHCCLANCHAAAVPCCRQCRHTCAMTRASCTYCPSQLLLHSYFALTKRTVNCLSESKRTVLLPGICGIAPSALLPPLCLPTSSSIQVASCLAQGSCPYGCHLHVAWRLG